MVFSRVGTNRRHPLGVCCASLHQNGIMIDDEHDTLRLMEEYKDMIKELSFGCTETDVYLSIFSGKFPLLHTKFSSVNCELAI
jgi:hypothetical protein